MPLEIHTSEGGQVAVMRVSGTLSNADYEAWEKDCSNVPSLLIEVRGLQGWDVASGWQNLTLSHDEEFAQFERVAFVGDERDEPYLATFSQLFAQNEIRVFSLKDMDAAMEWLRTGQAGEEISTRSLPHPGA